MCFFSTKFFIALYLINYCFKIKRKLILNANFNKMYLLECPRIKERSVKADSMKTVYLQLVKLS